MLFCKRMEKNFVTKISHYLESAPGDDWLRCDWAPLPDHLLCRMKTKMYLAAAVGAWKMYMWPWSCKTAYTAFLGLLDDFHLGTGCVLRRPLPFKEHTEGQPETQLVTLGGGIPYVLGLDHICICHSLLPPFNCRSSSPVHKMAEQSCYVTSIWSTSGLLKQKNNATYRYTYRIPSK